MVRKRLKKIVAVMAFYVALHSCSANVVFESNEVLPSKGWKQDHEIVFEVEISDTLNLHDMYVNVRNTTDYEFSNLYLFLDIFFPGGTVLRDTLECILAEKSGKWTGSGFGKIKSNRFLFRTDVWFPETGKYQFVFQQAMRTDNLEGISDVGICIERK